MITSEKNDRMELILVPNDVGFPSVVKNLYSFKECIVSLPFRFNVVYNTPSFSFNIFFFLYPPSNGSNVLNN